MLSGYVCVQGGCSGRAQENPRALATCPLWSPAVGDPERARWVRGASGEVHLVRECVVLAAHVGVLSLW